MISNYENHPARFILTSPSILPCGLIPVGGVYTGTDCHNISWEQIELYLSLLLSRIMDIIVSLVK